MSQHTIHFDNVHEAQALTGKHAELLPDIADSFGVELTARDTWLRVEGPDPKIADLTHFLSCLRKARNQGVALKKHTIIYAMRAFKEGRGEQIGTLFDCRIDVHPEKAPIFPKTLGQKGYIDTIRNKDITFGIGPAGTGKTYLAMAEAVSSLLRGDTSRIILTRPAIEAGEALGFLPGDIHQKILPYLRPLYDALYDMMPALEIEKHMDQGVVEVAPLAYMRGRTLNHAFVILDESQNTTPEQMLMFLTRLGFDSKCVVTGDLTQIDLPENKVSGLQEARQTLQRIKDIGFVELGDIDVVRHELVQKIIKAYRMQRGHDRPQQIQTVSPSSANNPALHISSAS